jgi:hypothetical protein
MDDPYPPQTHHDIGAVCWALSVSDVMLPNCLFTPGMKCNHPAKDARKVVNHLHRLEPAQRTELGTRLARLKDQKIHAWAEHGACELCTHLRTLAEAAAP